MTRDTSHSRSPRVFLADNLAVGGDVVLAEAQAHHLRQVLRLEDGAALRLFNPRDGEFAGYLRYQGKRGASATLDHILRETVALPDIWLVASPLKKDALDVMVEKASELGAARFVPVIADHTAVHRLNGERLLAQAIDAAEQCERLDVMDIAPLRTLSETLRDWPASRVLYVALERSAALPLLQALRDIPPERDAPLALLVGPEGGFSEAEREHILALPFVQPVSLGATILRAETAALAGLAVLSAFLQSK